MVYVYKYFWGLLVNGSLLVLQTKLFYGQTDPTLKQ